MRADSLSFKVARLAALTMAARKEAKRRSLWDAWLKRAMALLGVRVPGTEIRAALVARRARGRGRSERSAAQRAATAKLVKANKSRWKNMSAEARKAEARRRFHREGSK